MRQLIIRPWSQAEIDRLKDLASQGASTARCAAALNRPMSSVRKLARKLGLPLVNVRQLKAVNRRKIEAAERNLTAGQQKNDGSYV
jgi:hypothetical protein